MENDAGPSEPRSNLLTNALVSIWHQVMVDSKDQVELGAGAYPVTKTSSKRLRQVQFTVAGRQLVGVEQNPRTTSLWAQRARHGARIMQFLEGDHYVANVADGNVIFY